MSIRPDCRPLTPDCFDELAALFDGDSITRGCWCMWWRVAAKDWKANTRDERREAFRRRVAVGPPPGLLLYEEGAPVGWVQITPRADVPRYNRARSARPTTDDIGLDRAWIISCFFIRKDARGRGLMTQLANAACAYAADQGAAVVEAAPIAPRRELVWGEAFVGVRSSLEHAGFVEVEQRTKLRALMRWTP